MPPLTLTSAPIDPFQYPHWSWRMPPLILFNTPIEPPLFNTLIDPALWPWPTPLLTLFNTTIDFLMPPLTLSPCPHWPWAMPPLTLHTTPTEFFSMSPLTLFNTPIGSFNTSIENVQRPDWKFSTLPNPTRYAPMDTRHNSAGYAPYPHQRL